MLLRELQLAEELGVQPCTLREWRVTGRGPAFVKIGRAVRYRRIDIDAWVAAQVRTSTSDPGPDASRTRRLT